MFGLFGRNKETAVATLPTVPPNFPELERKHILMCLVSEARLVRRGQIERLAQDLYQDLLEGSARPVADSFIRAGGLDRSTIKRILSNPILTRVGLSYDQTEMTKQYSSLVVDPLNPPGPIDAYAGSGPPRKLIKELYSLRSFSSVVIGSEVDQTGRRAEVFMGSYRGSAHSEALTSIIERIDWYNYGDPLIMVGRYYKAAISKHQPRS